MEPKESNSNRLENMKCIWMTSKIVSYKLCNKDFCCERCLFDKAMRNSLTEADLEEQEAVPEYETDSNMLDNKIHLIRTERYDKNLTYLINNFILKKIAGNTYYIGFNPVLMHLLDTDIATEFREDYRFLYKGETFFKILGGWGSIDVAVPFNFFFIDKINPFHENTQHFKWFAIVGVQQSVVNENSALLKEWEQGKESVLAILGSYKEQFSTIGKSMYDGGEKINHLYKVIGTDNYINMLNNMINLKK